MSYLVRYIKKYTAAVCVVEDYSQSCADMRRLIRNLAPMSIRYITPVLIRNLAPPSRWMIRNITPISIRNPTPISDL